MSFLLENHLSCFQSAAERLGVELKGVVIARNVASIEINDYLVRLDGKTVVLYNSGHCEGPLIEEIFSRLAAIKCLEYIKTTYGLKKKSGS